MMGATPKADDGYVYRSVTREQLEARWDSAMVAPWRAGQGTRLWKRLTDDFAELVMRLAMVDQETVYGAAYGRLTDEVLEFARRHIVTELEARGLARTGYEGIGTQPEPVQ